jgi:two-component sensor histidine kinase
MRTLFSALRANTRYKVDFSLVPIAIILIEISVFITKVTSNSSGDIGNLLLLRLFHTVFMVIISSLVSQTYKTLKKFELSYRALAITGVFVITLGDLSHEFMASRFGVNLIGNDRRIGIILLQGSVWFPAFIILAGNRSEILRSFKEYEQRLITATRIRFRISSEFTDVQKRVQDGIRTELYNSCNTLKDAITQISKSSVSLAEKNSLIRALLLGESLRKFSRRLEFSDSKIEGQGSLKRSVKSLYLLLRQSRFLNETTTRISPLRYSSYPIVLIALVTPLYFYFYSIREFFFSYSLLLGLTTVFARLIIKMQSGRSPKALNIASILIFLSGLLPLVIDLLGQAILQDSKSQFPILISALALPLTYFISMEAFQVLRPSALRIIRSEELKASPALQEDITNRVSREFSESVSHQWAVYIHGKILTRLSATSLKLESASDSGDAQVFNETVESLFTLLGTPDLEFEESAKNLEAEVASRLNPWIGLLDINLFIDSDLKGIRNSRVQDLGEVIEELISNSIRHGKAKKIELKILSLGENDLEVIATDDAKVAPGGFRERSGLGTRIFNLASDGRWLILRVGSTTEFRLTMNIRG